MSSKKEIIDHYNDIVKGQRVNNIKTRGIIILFGVMVLVYPVFLIGVVKHFDSNRIILEADGQPRNFKVVNEKQAREIEAKAHMERFYKTFYSFSVHNIDKNIEDAMWLGDKSIEKLYMYYKDELNWYNVLMKDNIIQISEIVEINIDMGQYPYKVEIKGIMHLYRELVEKTYWLNGSCYLENIDPQYPRNPNGFLIRNWEQDELIPIE